MKFELNYKEINFIITLEKEKSFSPDKRFQKLGKNTEVALKNNQLSSYSMLIESNKNNEILVHYFPNIILSSIPDELMDDLQSYIEDEGIIEEICEYWIQIFELENGPKWKI